MLLLQTMYVVRLHGGVKVGGRLLPQAETAAAVAGPAEVAARVRLWPATRTGDRSTAAAPAGASLDSSAHNLQAHCACHGGFGRCSARCLAGCEVMAALHRRPPGLACSAASKSAFFSKKPASPQASLRPGQGGPRDQVSCTLQMLRLDPAGVGPRRHVMRAAGCGPAARHLKGPARSVAPGALPAHLTSTKAWNCAVAAVASK